MELPEGLEVIEEDCFWHSGLEEITIPKSVKRIEKYTFRECKSLQRVVF